jgi:transposase
VTTEFGVELSTSEPQTPQLVPSTSLCEPFREAIELGLSQGRNATAIWQDLVSESGFRGGYQTVKRFVRKLRGNRPPQPRAVIVTAPGEEVQTDYGTGPMVRDPQTGKYRRTRLFVLTLGMVEPLGSDIGGRNAAPPCETDRWRRSSRCAYRGFGTRHS